MSLLTAAVLVSCGDSPREEGEARLAKAVELAPVEQRNLPETVQGIGTLEAPQNVQVAAEAAGRIMKIHFQQGEPVDQGELLFTIRAEKTRQQLNARQAALTEAQAEFENARSAYRRRQQLLEENIISRETRDEAKTAMEKARARTEQIQAEIARLREEMEETRVTAPVAGVTGERQVDVGDYVDVGEPLVSVVQIRQLNVAFTLPERYLGQIESGQSITVRSPAWPQRTFDGEVFFISPQIRESTRDILLKANIANPDLLLRPGGFAAVEVIIGTHEGALVIPEEALVPTRTGYLVFVVKDGTARKRDVEIGLRRPGLVEIRQGLSAGEQVIRRGHTNVADGDRVRPVREEGVGSGGEPKQ